MFNPAFIVPKVRCQDLQYAIVDGFNEGDPLYLPGRGWIDLKGEMVYQCLYHASLVNQIISILYSSI
jgi:hypothetical protein